MYDLAHRLNEILGDEPELKPARSTLNTVRHLHRENIRWLNRSLKASTDC